MIVSGAAHPLQSLGAKSPPETEFFMARSLTMNDAAFDAFYRRVSGGLWSYIHRVVGDAFVADDLFQKTFYRLLRQGESVPSEPDHLRRYLYRIASNLIVDHWREAGRERKWLELGVAPLASSSQPDLRHDMMTTFKELRPRERALLWLAHVEEASHAEIAGALEIGEKSVRVLLFRARKKLASILEKRGLSPEGSL